MNPWGQKHNYTKCLYLKIFKSYVHGSKIRFFFLTQKVCAKGAHNDPKASSKVKKYGYLQAGVRHVHAQLD